MATGESGAGRNRQWLLARRPSGMVSEADFELVERPVPEIGPGEVLGRIRWLSFEPAMRGWMDDRESYVAPVELGAPMRAPGLAEVVASNDPAYAPGDVVFGMMSWSEYVSGRWSAESAGRGYRQVPTDVPEEMLLGPLGSTGLTAYVGMLDVGRPEPGDTVVVSGAAGATGSVAAQIARIKGCRVVGIAGGAEKCGWLLREARVDAAIDYKSEDVAHRLRQTCPDGVDVYFENVGGATLEAVLDNLALGARIALCGLISGYNDAELQPGPRNLFQLIVRRASIHGLLLWDFLDRIPEAFADLRRWVEAGQIAYRVDVQEGFEDIPRTFLRLFTGANEGKQLLRL